MLEPAKRLEKISIRFMGPHSSDLFKCLYIPPVDFEHVSIGTGESKSVAATRAIAHLQGEGFSPILDEIRDAVSNMMPGAPDAVEGDGFCQIYCIIGVTAER